MLKRGFLTLFLLAVMASSYAAAPFYTAWTIRAAAKAGDVSYLKSKIDWVAIKPGLKISLTEMALNPNGPKAATTVRTQLGLWQRIKAYSTRVFIHSFVERYANADGFETLVTYGRMVRGERASDDHLPLSTRISRVWSRVQRAAFTSMTRFELDLADKDDRTRIYCGVFILKDWAWKLVELRIRHIRGAQVAQLAHVVVARQGAGGLPR